MTSERIRGAAERDEVVPKCFSTEVTARTRRALWLVLVMFCQSLLLVSLGIYTTTRTESLSVTGYISGVVLTFGSFLGVLGLCLEVNRKQLLTAAIVFLSFGIITSFLCLVIDGVFIVFNMDIRPLKAGRCQFYSSGSSVFYDNYYVSVPCRNLKESCSMTIRSGTCYCCDLYNCANGGYLNNYYEFAGVRGCEDVLTLYILIWILTSLNLVAFFTSLLTTAVLGSVKDLRSSSVALTLDPNSRMSSPTAPLLMAENTHAVHQLHPGGSMCLAPADGTLISQSYPSSPNPHLESNPPPFVPLSNLLPYKLHGFSA